LKITIAAHDRLVIQEGRMISSEPSDISHSWYRQSFGDLYSLIYAHRNSEAADREIRLMSQWVGLKPGQTVLDACCGDGRHTQSLLRLECDAFGFDLSPELVIRAQSDSLTADRICRADIRKIPFSSMFDFVLNLFTSFGYFYDDNENRVALEQMATCLKPGGTLILDHINASRVRRTLIERSESRTGQYQIVQHRRIVGNRVQKRIEVTGSEGRTHVFNEDVRMFSPDEVIQLADICGLIDISLHGSFCGDVFDERSERMILRARRPCH
jgi:SAM-dependent methyltransferase